MKAYRFLPEADDEFQEHIRYFDGSSRDRGDRFIDEVADAVRDIRQHPQIGPAVAGKVRQRVLHSFEYSVLYVDRPDEIIIVAVAAHQRRPGYWRKRLRQIPT